MESLLHVICPRNQFNLSEVFPSYSFRKKFKRMIVLSLFTQIKNATWLVRYHGDYSRDRVGSDKHNGEVCRHYKYRAQTIKICTENLSVQVQSSQMATDHIQEILDKEFYFLIFPLRELDFTLKLSTMVFSYN